MIKKRYNLKWVFQAPEAVLTLSTLKCKDKWYLVFGGHDRNLYLMDKDINIIDEITFDGWCRCSFTTDLDGDGCEEILVGAGDGSMLALRYDENKNDLVGLMHKKAKLKINCCTAGDLSEDGEIEVIFGGEDKTLRIYKNILAEKPLYTLFYDSWVTSCSIGLIKHPKFKKAFHGLLVGTKNGKLQLIKMKDQELNILWEKDVSKRINDIEIGDVTNDGKNEIIIAVDDSYIKILSGSGERIRYIKVYGGRPLTLKVDDIDGDNAKEIIAGCADGSLKIYHNQELNSTKMKLKWKTEVSTSIKDISTLKIDETGINHIIFGGYDRAIRNLTDFEWGRKESLEISKKIKPPEIPLKNLSDYEEQRIKEPVPTNVEDLIEFIFGKRNYIYDLDTLSKELREYGYSEKKIKKKLKKLKDQEILRHRIIEKEFWTFEAREEIEEIETPIEEEIEVKQKEPEKLEIEDVITEPADQKRMKPEVHVEKKKEKAREKESLKSLRQTIIDFLQKNELVSTKAKLLEGITKQGFDEENVKKEIDLLNAQDVIDYSRSKPRGWSLISKKPELSKDKLKKKGDKKTEIQEEIIDYLKENEPVSSKSDLINAITENGFDDSDVEDQIDKLNKEDIISYSRSKPRGWSLKK